MNILIPWGFFIGLMGTYCFLVSHTLSNGEMLILLAILMPKFTEIETETEEIEI